MRMIWLMKMNNYFLKKKKNYFFDKIIFMLKCNVVYVELYSKSHCSTTCLYLSLASKSDI